MKSASSLLRILVPSGMLAISVAAMAQAPLDLMPLPASSTASPGEFLIDARLSVRLNGYTEPRLLRAQQRFLDRLFQETGIPVSSEPSSSQASFQIDTAGPGNAIQSLGEDESYRLEITPNSVHLAAPNPLGVLHGLQTFLQLVRITSRGFAVPAVTIDDKPRFPWRGLMIDSGRHFIPLPVIERNLDAMEAVKLNVFHWHLSDDQGFRVESKAFPLLQQKGSGGLYYTQDQIRHIVAYAHDRGIRVVPEFDMPAHATSWFIGYPQLASGKGPYQIAQHWGVLDAAMDPTQESTYKFLDVFLGEMTSLFPDAYFHIGGDECNGKEWDANPRIQGFKRKHEIKDNATLQAMFTARVQTLVTSHHKIAEGWDEILQPGTPKSVVIQSWRGRDSLLDSAKRGYRALLSNGYYIDLNQSASEHYLVDPLEGIADKLTPEQQAAILGGEATIWSEFVSGETIDSRIWPRTAAIAERFWSPQQVRDVDSMYARLAMVEEKLKFYDIDPKDTTERMLERMSGDIDPAALRILASVAQPPKGYVREDIDRDTALSPLNRLVDAVPPESETARQFSLIVSRMTTGKATPEDRRLAHDWLTLWRDNDAKLQPTLAKSAITAELAPLSKSLHDVAEIGLQALESYQTGTPLTRDTQRSDLDHLKAAETPQAVLILAIVPAVEQLVQSAEVH